MRKENNKEKVVKKVNSRNASVIAKILGAPKMKRSGIYLDKKIGEKTVKGEPIFTLFSENEYNIKEAKDSLAHFPILEYD